MHAGAAMVAIQEGVPSCPAGIDTFGWSLKNRRTCCVVWGEPIDLDLPRNGKGYKEGAAIVEEEIVRLWRRRRRRSPTASPRPCPTARHGRSRSPSAEQLTYPELPKWQADEDWAETPLGPGLQRLTET